MSSFAASRLQSPYELAEYCLRSLGSPVINIEIDEDQLMDRINEAIEQFLLRHFEGTTELWKPYIVNKDDVQRGYIQLPEDVTAVLGCLDFNRGVVGRTAGGEEFERLNFLLAQTDLVRNLGHRGGLLDYHITISTIRMFSQYFSPDPSFRYNAMTQRLYVQGKLEVGRMFILHYFEVTDPDEFVNVYNNEFVKKFATALVGRQWGSNIRKYEGVQLPGGVVLAGETIYQDYKEQVAEHMRELQTRYEEPPMGFMQ